MKEEKKLTNEEYKVLKEALKSNEPMTELKSKEQRALEIIKETLGIFFYENELGYFIDIGHCCSYKLKDKEQFDLLKEVLLCQS